VFNQVKLVDDTISSVPVHQPISIAPATVSTPAVANERQDIIHPAASLEHHEEREAVIEEEGDTDDGVVGEREAVIEEEGDTDDGVVKEEEEEEINSEHPHHREPSDPDLGYNDEEEEESQPQGAELSCLRAETSHESPKDVNEEDIQVQHEEAELHEKAELDHEEGEHHHQHTEAELVQTKPQQEEHEEEDEADKEDEHHVEEEGEGEGKAPHLVGSNVGGGQSNQKVIHGDCNGHEESDPDQVLHDEDYENDVEEEQEQVQVEGGESHPEEEEEEEEHGDGVHVKNLQQGEQAIGEGGHKGGVDEEGDHTSDGEE